MHFSANRGIEIARRPSVCDVGGSGPHRLEIARTYSTTPSLFVAQRPSTYSQGNMGKFWKDYRWDGKVACWSKKAAISLKRLKTDETLLWRTYRNSPTLFRTVPPPTPYGLPFSKIGGSQPQPIWPVYSQVHLNKSPSKIL